MGEHPQSRILIKTSKPFICNSYGEQCRDGVLVGTDEALILKQLGELSDEVKTSEILNIDPAGPNVTRFNTVECLKRNNFILKEANEAISAYYPALRTKKLLDSEAPLTFFLQRPSDPFVIPANNNGPCSKTIVAIGDSQDALLFVETKQFNIDDFRP